MKEMQYVFAKRPDERPPLDRALEAAATLKPGTWASVEALSMLAIEAQGRPEAQSLYESALDVAGGLSSGSWESVRALAWLARADRNVPEGER